MSGVTFCSKCGNIMTLKRDRRGKMSPYCNKCGFREEKMDTEAYKITVETKGGKGEGKAIVIDREKQLEELKKKYGDRKTGASCPKCGSFYLTKSLMATRGDEPGRIIKFCVACGYSFRRAKYIGPIEED